MPSAKLIISSPTTKSNSVQRLRAELSQRLGYKVLIVKPGRERGRPAVQFLKGLDKITQLRAFQAAGVPCPPFATSLDEARSLPTKRTVVRSLINGSEGRGITICNTSELTKSAPLYTGYIVKTKEFRVHVNNLEVCDVQEKRKRRGHTGVDTKVRNTANGYVFCRDGVVPPSGLCGVAVDAVRALGRNFGGVDVIWNEATEKLYVLEVNSRPGMEGSTAGIYANSILLSMKEQLT